MTSSLHISARVLRAAATTIFASASLFSASVAHTQNVATRWQPWVGCWAPSANAPQGSPGVIVGGDRQSNLLCVVPTSNADAVDIVTVSNNRVVHRETVNATGMQVAETRDNCPGWESASFSSDNHRLLFHSEFTCAGNTKIKGSGVFAISADGDFVQIQGTSVGTNTNSRVVRYQPANLQIASGASLSDSAIVRTVPLATGFAASSMRVAAGAPVGAGAIAEVTKNVDSPVAIAWINEIDQRFNVDGKELVTLANAGVSSDVIDMMVALSYPDKFAVRRTEGGVPVGGAAAPVTEVRARMGNDRDWDCGYGNRMMPYGYYGDGCFPRYGYGFGLGGYGYGVGGYGYNGYYGGYSPYNYYYGSSPVVIVTRGGGDNSDVRGHAVKGGGYRRDDGGGSSSTAQKSDKGSSSSGSGSTSSGSSGSTGSSSGGSTTTRTAKPRPPGK